MRFGRFQLLKRIGVSARALSHVKMDIEGWECAPPTHLARERQSGECVIAEPAC
jgi:hypothetical protein